MPWKHQTPFVPPQRGEFCTLVLKLAHSDLPIRQLDIRMPTLIRYDQEN